MPFKIELAQPWFWFLHFMFSVLNFSLKECAMLEVSLIFLWSFEFLAPSINIVISVSAASLQALSFSSVLLRCQGLLKANTTTGVKVLSSNSQDRILNHINWLLQSLFSKIFSGLTTFSPHTPVPANEWRNLFVGDEQGANDEVVAAKKRSEFSWTFSRGRYKIHHLLIGGVLRRGDIAIRAVRTFRPRYQRSVSGQIIDIYHLVEPDRSKTENVTGNADPLISL